MSSSPSKSSQIHLTPGATVLRDEQGRVLCPAHGEPALKRTSRTAANPNRDFYACNHPSAKDETQRCNFFKWADQIKSVPSSPETPQTIGRAPGSAPSPQTPSRVTQTLGREPGSASQPYRAQPSRTTPLAAKTSLPTPPKSAARQLSPEWPSDDDEDAMLEAADEVEQRLSQKAKGKAAAGRSATEEKSFRFRDGAKRAREDEEGDDESGVRGKVAKSSAMSDAKAGPSANPFLNSPTATSPSALPTTPLSSPTKDARLLVAAQKKLALLQAKCTRLEASVAEQTEEITQFGEEKQEWVAEKRQLLREKEGLVKRLEIAEGAKKLGRR